MKRSSHRPRPADKARTDAARSGKPGSGNSRKDAASQRKVSPASAAGLASDKDGTLTADQLRLIASPVTFEVFEAVQLGGAASAAELGQRLGRKPNSLHYHIRRLVGAGLLRQVDSRRSGARTEAVYDLPHRAFSGDPMPVNRRRREATLAAVASLTRLSARDYADAAKSMNRLVRKGPDRNILAHRGKAWLRPADLARVNAHLESIQQIFRTRAGAGGRTDDSALCSMTLILTPLQSRSAVAAASATRKPRRINRKEED